MENTDTKVELPETPEQLALKASEIAKNALPDKPWGGRYWDNDAKEYKENPAVIKADQARYWAKENCRYCYGRGIEGKIMITVRGNHMTMDQMCSCARIRYGKWRDAFVKQWLVPAPKEEEQVDVTKITETVDKTQEL